MTLCSCKLFFADGVVNQANITTAHIALQLAPPVWIATVLVVRVWRPVLEALDLLVVGSQLRAACGFQCDGAADKPILGDLGLALLPGRAPVHEAAFPSAGCAKSLFVDPALGFKNFINGFGGRVKNSLPFRGTRDAHSSLVHIANQGQALLVRDETILFTHSIKLLNESAPLAPAVVCQTHQVSTLAAPCHPAAAASQADPQVRRLQVGKR